MDHTGNTHHNLGPLQWVLWTFFVMLSYAEGAVKKISDVLPEVNLPTHEIKHLPQLADAIPHIVIAMCCVTATFFVNKALNAAWDALFPKKETKQ